MGPVNEKRKRGVTLAKTGLRASPRAAKIFVKNFIRFQILQVRNFTFFPVVFSTFSKVYVTSCFESHELSFQESLRVTAERSCSHTSMRETT